MLDLRVIVEQGEEHADAFDDGRPQLGLDPHPITSTHRLTASNCAVFWTSRESGVESGSSTESWRRGVPPRCRRPNGPVSVPSSTSPRPRTQNVSTNARACRQELAVPGGKAPLRFGNSGSQLVRIDESLVDLEERHVVIERLMQQNHELHQVRTRLLPKGFLATAKRFVISVGMP